MQYERGGGREFWGIGIQLPLSNVEKGWGELSKDEEKCILCPELCGTSKDTTYTYEIIRLQKEAKAREGENNLEKE